MTKPNLFPNGNLKPEQNPEWQAAQEKYKDLHPQDITTEQLNELGHEKGGIYQIIRKNCIDCVAGQPSLVRSCTMTWCPYWPYRMGFNPFNRKELTEEEKVILRERFQRNLGAKN